MSNVMCICFVTKIQAAIWFLFGTALKIKITWGRSPNARRSTVVVVFLKEVKVKKLLGQFFTTGILHKIKSRLGAIIIQESMRRENVLMNCQSDQVFEDSNQQTIQATSATSAERNWLAVRIWIEGFNMHVAPAKVSTCKGCIATTRKQHPIKPWITKRNKTIWIQQSRHIFNNLSSNTVFFAFGISGACILRFCWKKVCRAFCAILYLHRRMNLAIRTPKMFF